MITKQTSKSSLLKRYWQALFAKDVEDLRNRRKLLYIIIFLIFAIEVVLFINDSIQLPQHLERWVTLFILLTFILLILILLLKKHYINLSTVLLIFSLWFLITLFSFISGGIFTNLTRGYMIITFLAGLLGSIPFGGFVGLLSILTDLSFTFLADQIAPPIARSATSQWLINTFNIVLVIFLQAYFVKNLRKAFRNSSQLARQHKQVEQSLVESEQRFQAVFDQTDISVLLFKKDLKISNVNEAFCKLIGYSSQEIVGSNYS
ncbi:MAG: PAS domain S-box protein, partial [Leptonema sp. (in: Bacteria)]|nr:PAS domain S-box protein [Leptonema sp. (in: bacteria)]